MSKITPCLAASASLLLFACVAPTVEAPPAQEPAPVESAAPMVGGAAMDPARSLSENLGRSNEHRTLVAGLRAAGLSDRLSQGGSFTLFAPTDTAFSRLPRGTMESLNAPANRSLLGRVLNYHIVPGNKTRTQIAADSRAGGGIATYRTAEGGSIRVALSGDRIVVTDVHGNRSSVTTADVRQANGVLHVLDGVLLPAI